MKTLVTGCGRSGTGYAAMWFGLGHERMSPAGISSWYLAASPSSLPPWHEAISPETQFDQVIHIVRHPVKCVASLQTISRGSWAWAQRYIGLDPESSRLVDAMRFWLQWNALAEMRALAAGAGITPLHIESLQSKTLSRDINSRQHEPLTWDDLMKADETLCCRVKDLALRYGYVAE